MAYNPISGFTLQIVTQAGEVASDYYLKFYEANTTTPLSMATDSAGGTLLVKAKLSDSGFPISNPLDNSTVFIPHMNANYRMVVYTSEADADANNTAAAYVNIPFVSTLVGASAVGTAAYLDTGTEAGELPTNGDLPTFGGSASSDVPTNADLAPYLGRNLIINGDFSVWQRGTSHSTDGYGSADRWLLGASGATHSLSRQTHTLGQTDVHGNPKYFMRHDVTSGNDFVTLSSRIEDVVVTAAREVTLSFWAKGTNPGGGSHTIYAEQRFGTGGSPSSNVLQTVTESLAVTGSWVRYSFTFTPASLTGKTLGTNGDDCLALYFDQGSDTSTDAWQLDISNVQLEFGDTATDFEYVDPATQLARCKRYFERIVSDAAFQPIAAGYSENASSARGMMNYTEKRAVPSITLSTVSDFVTIRAGTDITATSMNVLAAGRKSARLNNNTAGHTTGEACIIAFSNTSGYVDINAEL